MSTLDLDGASFHYVLEGPGGAPVLLFSNSLGTDLSLWDAQAEALRDTYQVLRYDTRGHGSSVKNAGPYTIEQLGRDVLKLADALELPRFSFCGISMGGLIGQWLGRHAPERLERLVLANTAARIGTAQAWSERAALVRKEGMQPVVAGTPARWFTARFVSTHPEIVDPWLQALGRTDPEGYAACCEAIGQADFRDELQRIHTPTLVLTGRHDPVTTPEHADYIAGRIAGARRIDLDASHLSNLEDAEGFNRALRAHLQP
ncbi:3-oxoadipate enol-lactonase [Allopusillimonas soli]|uniref:3-oxoadipate enol-lactonase n=1 Tax=Allopusillimonas soli TaxID=659016 RepID=A0A853F5X9_9BURK|nr:3-oxoadipate enol-lactonase [Allopusillimonas soli]NYT35945.1 3-oxoadipate enol-lactonase [Allopusillimonas soli]TEA76296.1 3-oxoadipate enol-lactonase [Allopusillimonas soli]